MFNYLEKLKLKNIAIIPLEPYISSSTKILHRCTCGTEWNIRPNNILNGQKCTMCKGKFIVKSKTKDNKQYLKQLIEKNIKVKPLEIYSGAISKILHRCTCGNEWKQTPTRVLQGATCGCQGRTYRTNETYKQELMEKNILVKPIEKFINTKTKILHRCVCGTEWNIIPKSVLNNIRCPACKENKLDLYKDRATILYYIKVDNLFKIGITIFDRRMSIENNILKKRFKNDVKKGLIVKIIKTKVFDNGAEAYINEQKILSNFKDYQYVGEPILISGNTELFNKDIKGVNFD